MVCLFYLKPPGRRHHPTLEAKQQQLGHYLSYVDSLVVQPSPFYWDLPVFPGSMGTPIFPPGLSSEHLWLFPSTPSSPPAALLGWGLAHAQQHQQQRSKPWSSRTALPTNRSSSGVSGGTEKQYLGLEAFPPRCYSELRSFRVHMGMRLQWQHFQLVPVCRSVATRMLWKITRCLESSAIQ